MKKMFTFLFATLMTLLSSTANAVEVTVFEPDQFYTSVDELLEAESFAIVNKTDGKALFGSNAQNLGYDVYANAFKATNSGYQWKLVDADENGNYFLQLITPTGANYNCWGKGGYLNSQGEPQGWACSFILGLNGQKGQDIPNGAVYTLTYTSNGWTIYNVGTSMYQPYSTGPANSTEATYWEFCSLKENTYDDGSNPEPVPDPLDKMVQMATDGTLFTLSTGDQYLYGTGQQGLAMGTKEEAEASENFYSWKLEQDSEYPSEFRFIATKTDGTNFVAWGANPSYLNTQPALTGVTFVLGKDQDITKGSEWYIESAQGGYTIKNRANNGYLAGTGVSEEPVIWKFNIAGEEPEPEPEPEGPAQAEIADGKYYIVNQDAEAFLSNGAYWGTRAVFVKDNGIAYNVKRNLENGKYTLYSGIKGDTKALRPSDGFNDQSGEWEIIKTDDQNGGVYLYNGEKYFSHVEGSMIPEYVDEPTAGSVWNFVTLDMIKEDLANATRENPRNATFLIKAADFLNGDVANAAWDGYKVGGASGSGNTIINNTNSEKWNAGTYTVSQTVEGLPNGFYNLTAFGFYREGNRDQVAASDAFEAGTENASILKANNKKVALKSVYSEAKEAKEGGWSSESTSTSEKTYYIPNSQADAAACFEAGAYVNELKNIEVTDGTLTISVSREGDAIFDWTVFDNFRLEYLGTETYAEGTTLKLMPGGNSNLPIPDDAARVFTFNSQWSNTVPTPNSFDASIYKEVVIEFAEALPFYYNTPYKNAAGEQQWGGVAQGNTEYRLDLTSVGSITDFNIQNVQASNTEGDTFTINKAYAVKLDGTTEPITFAAPGWGGSMTVSADIYSANVTFNGQWANIGIDGLKGLEGNKLIRLYTNSPINAAALQYCIKTADGNDGWPQLDVKNENYAECYIKETLESCLLQWRIEEAGSLDIAAITVEVIKPAQSATINSCEMTSEIPVDQTLSADDADFKVTVNYAVEIEGCEGGLPSGEIAYTVKDANGNIITDSSTDFDVYETSRNIYLKGLKFDETYTFSVSKISVNYLDLSTFDYITLAETSDNLPSKTFTVAPPVKISNEAIAIQNVDLDANTAEASYSFKAAINAEYPDATAKVSYDIIDENGDVVANGTADVDLNTVPAIIKLENIPANGKFIVKIKNIDIYKNASATDPIYNISSSAVGFCGIYQGYIASTGMLLTNGVSKSLEQNETVAVSAGEITFSRVMIPVVNINTGNFTVPVTTETNAEGQTIYKAQGVDVELHDVYISGGQDDPVPFKAWLVGIESTDGPILFLHLQSNLQDLFIAFNSRLQDAKWMMNSIAPEEVNAGGAKIINFLEATSINSVATDAKADGKFFENGKVVIKNNDKKYNVNGAIIK